jgi:hypothetical protein
MLTPYRVYGLQIFSPILLGVVCPLKNKAHESKKLEKKKKINLRD